MRKLVAVMLFSCLPVMSFAAGGGNNEYVVDAPVNLQDKVSLQNGAKLFVNYCMGCHSMEYLRYGRMAEDLGIPDDLVLENLNFTSDKIGDPMENGMAEEDGKQCVCKTEDAMRLCVQIQQTSDKEGVVGHHVGHAWQASRIVKGLESLVCLQQRSRSLARRWRAPRRSRLARREAEARRQHRVAAR